MNKYLRLLRYDWPMHFFLLWTNWMPDNIVFLRFRGYLIRPFFLSCGENLRIGRNVVFYNPSKIIIGNDVYIAYGTWISARDKITVRDKVTIGPYCVLSSSNHKRVENSYFNPDALIGPIDIGEGCWLGAHSVITAGCRIGSGSVLGAGAIVVNDIPDNVLACGVPAKPIKEYNL